MRSKCSISYHVPECTCHIGTVLNPLTEPNALYVLQSTVTRLYYTQSKAKGKKAYWGQFIGKGKGKKCSAIRFYGGPELDRLLLLPGNKDIRAIKVKE